jgi:CheY-like chemotaxis protein
MDDGEDTATATAVKDLTPCNGGVVLLVDDESAIRRLFQLILGAALPGCRIETAADGSEAVRMFSEGHHGVIVMDLHMPVMDGPTAFLSE